MVNRTSRPVTPAGNTTGTVVKRFFSRIMVSRITRGGATAGRTDWSRPVTRPAGPAAGGKQAFFRSSSASKSDSRRQRTAWTRPVTVSSRTRAMAGVAARRSDCLLGRGIDLAQQPRCVVVLGVDGPVQALLHGGLHQAHVEDLHHHSREGLGRDLAGRRRAPREQFAQLLAVQRQDQLGGGGKVAVQRPQWHVRLGSHLGQDHGVQALAGKPGGDIKDPHVTEPLPGQGGRRGHRWKF